uniref:Uncharacterized protein n=1 Tax=Rhizophora mucronata TaxID=61149 RepID=A0A2P2KMY8_RHIMU
MKKTNLKLKREREKKLTDRSERENPKLMMGLIDKVSARGLVGLRVELQLLHEAYSWICVGFNFGFLERSEPSKPSEERQWRKLENRR